MKFMEKAKRFFTLNAANHEGFTLVELIVVIAILAILAGVAVPAYSGYIKRAEKAGDLQLLGAVNEAFAAACMSEGVWEDANLASVAKMPIVNGKVNLEGVAPAEVKDDFALFYQGNENATFKSIKALQFNPTDKVFVESGSVYENLTFNREDVNAFKGGIFGKDVAVLLGTVDDAAGNVANMLSDFPSLENLVGGQRGQDALAALYGMTWDKFVESEEFANLMDQKLTLMENDPAYNGMSDPELMNAALNQMMVSNVLMSTAKNDTFDYEGFANKLATDGYGAINTGSENADETLSQVTMAYAMYAGFMQTQNKPVSSDPADVKNVLDTKEFKDYMATAGNDVASYQGALGMIVDSSSNTDALSDLLINGFSNDALTEMLQNATK